MGNEKKKVLFVITKGSFGGAQRYVYDLATNLPAEDFEVAVLMGGAGTLTDKLTAAHIRTITVPTLLRDINPLLDLKSFFALLRVFRAEKPDIVHLNSAKASGLGALAARIARVPFIVFTAHGWAFNEERSPLSKQLITLLSWLTVVLAHKTIAVSHTVARDTATWPLIKNKITTVHNCIGKIDFYSREEARGLLAASTGRKIPTDAFLIGTTAELHRNKGLSYAVAAVGILTRGHRDLSYLVMGDGEERGSLGSLIDTHKLREHVFLLGFVEDAARYLKAFDCFILPSVKEGFPYAILEAGRAGLPVVSTRVGGIPEIIDSHKNGILIESKNSEELAEALRFLATNPDKRGAFGAALKEKVEFNFALEVMIRQTVVIYTRKK